MFTGIVEEVGRVTAALSGMLTVTAGSVLQGVEPGCSMAVNGVCLTVTDLTNTSFSVDVMPETLRRTNLGLLEAGDGVNLERPLAVGGRLGGHFVQGHVDDTGRVASITPEGEAMMVAIEAAPGVMHYVVEKGFIAVDGVSLTIVNRDAVSFRVSLVDYTLKHTTLGGRRVGDRVNLEVDIIAKYVEQINRKPGAGVTVDFLSEHGFLAD